MRKPMLSDLLGLLGGFLGNVLISWWYAAILSALGV
jgi:hypothetical protein